MKASLTFILAILFFIISSGQATDEFCDFETHCAITKIDTNLRQNLWQIGYPVKSVFNYGNLTNKIVTDTLLPYGVNNLSTFYVRIIPTGWDFWIDVQFDHFFDTDSLKDGGFIEISVDGGMTWTNIINSQYLVVGMDFNLYSNNDTLFNGNPGFSGFSGIYQYSGFELEMFEIDTLDLRFCFISDNIDNQRNGWSIDNLYIWGFWEGIDEKDHIQYNLYPNPVINKSKLTFKNPDFNKFTLEITDCFGRLIQKQTEIWSNEVTISNSGLSKGIYFFKLFDANNAHTCGQFVVQ